ncbi:hypothetical protein Xen7305DRAFT_00011380 [Xenococcus sp. PCC 7305]|nr:hypothetical protein Xen7305DRAFT_00011380 [Xenococcus sp. PCC 7305]
MFHKQYIQSETLSMFTIKQMYYDDFGINLTKMGMLTL